MLYQSVGSFTLLGRNTRICVQIKDAASLLLCDSFFCLVEVAVVSRWKDAIANPTLLMDVPLLFHCPKEV